MLKSIMYLLAIITMITTPTRAYEAYKINSFIVLHQQQLNKQAEREITNVISKSYNELKPSIPQAGDVCGIALAKAENKYQIKKDLLQTIASVESGRWDKKKEQRIAWPWTVQSNGKGHFYNSKDEAIAAVKELMDKGVTNIDVGCMQINLKYHKNAFKNVEEALDPEKNVDYSAKYLLGLYRQSKNWTTAAMQYHSKNHTDGEIYKKKLEKHYAKHIKPQAIQTLLK